MGVGNTNRPMKTPLSILPILPMATLLACTGDVIIADGIITFSNSSESRFYRYNAYLTGAAQ
jgi:hypothetical protein